MLPFVCLLVFGCDPDSESVGDGPESGEGSGSASGDDSTGGASGPTSDPATGDSMTSVGTTTGPEPTTTSGDESDGTDDTGGTDDTSGTSGGETTGSGESSGETGVPSECELEPLVCDVVENGKVLPQDVVDCGTVTLDDDAQAYADLRACILQASAQTAAYKGFVEVQGIDSGVWSAYGSLVGFVYSEHNWLYDNHQGEVTVWMADCAPIPSEDPECVPGPEFGLCLVCDDKHEAVCSSLE